LQFLTLHQYPAWLFWPPQKLPKPFQGLPVAQEYRQEVSEFFQALLQQSSLLLLLFKQALRHFHIPSLEQFSHLELSLAHLWHLCRPTQLHLQLPLQP
jgi:hypothetical protein